MKLTKPWQRDAPLHPLVQGLLDTLPKPGAHWSAEDREKWLRGAASIFDLIYWDDTEGRAALANEEDR